MEADGSDHNWTQSMVHSRQHRDRGEGTRRCWGKTQIPQPHIKPALNGTDVWSGRAGRSILLGSLGATWSMKIGEPLLKVLFSASGRHCRPLCQENPPLFSKFRIKTQPLQTSCPQCPPIRAGKTHSARRRSLVHRLPVRMSTENT